MCHHLFDSKTLHGEPLVLEDQPCGELVRKVMTAIVYLGVLCCHLLSCFLPILAAFLLPG